MRALRPTLSCTDFLHRCCALGTAALVLALTLFAASPTAHAWLHDDDAAAVPANGHEDRCAVILFASGVAMPLAAPAIAPPGDVLAAAIKHAPESLCLRSPRYLHLPERGPPATRVR